MLYSTSYVGRGGGGWAIPAVPCVGAGERRFFFSRPAHRETKDVEAQKAWAGEAGDRSVAGVRPQRGLVFSFFFFF